MRRPTTTIASLVCSIETCEVGQAQLFPIGIEPNPWPRRPPAVSAVSATFSSVASVVTRPPNLMGARYLMYSVSTWTSTIRMSVGLVMRNTGFLRRTLTDLRQGNRFVAKQYGNAVENGIQQGLVAAEQSAVDGLVHEPPGPIGDPAGGNRPVYSRNQPPIRPAQGGVIHRTNENHRQLSSPSWHQPWPQFPRPHCATRMTNFAQIGKAPARRVDPATVESNGCHPDKETGRGHHQAPLSFVAAAGARHRRRGDFNELQSFVSVSKTSGDS